MCDSDKIPIKQLDDKSDYGLWNIRVEVAYSAKRVQDALNFSVGIRVGDSQKTGTSGIIVSALSDSALRVVRSVIFHTAEMISKLYDRFE